MLTLRPLLVAGFIAVGSLLIASQAMAQSPPLPYGAPLSFEAAKKAMAAAEAEAIKSKWPVAIAILDTTGTLILFSKLDNTQSGSVAIAIGKAKTALDFRRPSKAFQDVVAGGGAGLRILGAAGIILPFEGGVPIVVDGKIVGAIGVSGVQSSEDAVVAMAGANAAAAK